ncbi:hypothetical protein [Halalkalibacter krulwichiae]|uniref:Uncharacterized protein n=1 Tax=Halalkalibacter krulwichiae TaxID=199441 RepID=A0A1X9MBL9_9BACI|nr:hypothetical protein [Halalkalibacter krulwichiae]ARK30788.1 hypothetical protein BkAM31D_13610 [Halalkalibacter krulwichiae]
MVNKESYSVLKASAFEELAEELEKDQLLSDEDRINILDYWYAQCNDEEFEDDDD